MKKPASCPKRCSIIWRRLGWSHGDDEIFSREQMVQWFDGSHLAKSPAQWDPAKLAWVNAHLHQGR